MAQHAAYFTVVLNDLKLVHRSYSGGRADEALDQCAILFRSAGIGQEVEMIQTARVEIAEPAGQCCESAADAL